MARINLPEIKDHCMHFMCEDKIICDVWYNYNTGKVRFKNYTNDWLLLPFGNRNDNAELTTDALDLALREYVFDETRYDCKKLLKSMGLDVYDPFQIVRKTHGVLTNSDCWIKFDDDPEALCWNDVMTEAHRYRRHLTNK